MGHLTRDQARALGVDHAPSVSPALQALIEERNAAMAAGLRSPAEVTPPSRWASARPAAAQKRAKAARAGRTARASGERDEALVLEACARYRAESRAIVKKAPTPIRQIGPIAPDGSFKAKRTAKAGVDFSGTVQGGRAVAFDAKGSSTAALPLEERGEPTLKPIQADELHTIHALGGIAGVLVRTAPQRNKRPVPTWWWLSWPAWLAAVADARAQGRASITAQLLNTHARPVDTHLGAPDWLPAALAGAEDNDDA